VFILSCGCVSNQGERDNGKKNAAIKDCYLQKDYRVENYTFAGFLVFQYNDAARGYC
jgi:hypothetical protein